MTPDLIISKLKALIAEAEGLGAKPRLGPEYKKWYRGVLVTLERAFGKNSSQEDDFRRIRFEYNGIHRVGDEGPFERRYTAALKEAIAILTSIHEEVAEFGCTNTDARRQEPTDYLERLFVHFHSVVRQLRSRHNGRPTLDVVDEYDVQDLLHALLRIYFLDIRAEEWTPSYAATSSRMDFLLHDEEIVVEVKRTRAGLRQRELVDELLVDITRYASHPKCKALICFIYDPEGWINNSAAIVGDLEKVSNTLKVQVFISPQLR